MSNVYNCSVEVLEILVDKMVEIQRTVFIKCICKFVKDSFTEKQYNAIVSAMMRLATNKPCKRETLKQEIDTAFGEELPDLLFDQIIKGFLVSSQQQNRLDGMTYQNIMRMLKDEGQDE